MSSAAEDEVSDGYVPQPRTVGWRRIGVRAGLAAPDHASEAAAPGISGMRFIQQATIPPAGECGCGNCCCRCYERRHLLVAFALARPRSMPRQLGDREGPVAAAFVFDTMPHMEYRHDNKTRLDAAAKWPSASCRMPEESQLAVLDSTHGAGVPGRSGCSQAADRRGLISTARAAIDATLEWAVELLKTWTCGRRFTCSRIWPAWPGSRRRPDGWLRSSRSCPASRVYLIDVGVTEPQDCGLGEIQLSNQILARTAPCMSART